MLRDDSPRNTPPPGDPSGGVVYLRIVIHITYSKCGSVSLVNQHAKHMFHIISSVAYHNKHIIPHYLTNSIIFGRKLLNMKCVLWLSLQFSLKVYNSTENSARHYHKFMYILMYSAHYTYHISMTHKFSWQIIRIFSNIKCHENLSSGSKLFHVYRWTGRHDSANSCT